MYSHDAVCACSWPTGGGGVKMGHWHKQDTQRRVQESFLEKVNKFYK